MLFIDDREYTHFELALPEGNQRVAIDDHLPPGFDPYSRRYFNRDVLEITDENHSCIRLIHSAVRTAEYLAGILFLEDGKTYGRDLKKRPMYRCIPDDKRIPVFLVPYEPRAVGFSKRMMNKYVLFRFESWTAEQDHPRAKLVETLGDVDQLDAFYSYQMYRRSLHVCMKAFFRRAQEAMRTSSSSWDEDILKHHGELIENFTQKKKNPRIFTIDNARTTDFDDALSISPSGSVVSVYVANVVFFLDKFDLWTAMTRRVATVYLPDKRRPMMPSILTEERFSLKEKTNRFCVEFRFEMSTSDDDDDDDADKEIGIRGMTIHHVYARISKNYRYSEPELWKDPQYQQLFGLTSTLDRNVRQPQDVVSFWMIKVNTWTAQFLRSSPLHRRGIFRAVQYTPGARLQDIPEDLDEDSRRVVMGWNYSSGKYVFVDDSVPAQNDKTDDRDMEDNGAAAGAAAAANHDMLGADGYVHITSPIRRLVDLLNQIVLLWPYCLQSDESANARSFFQDWVAEMTYINITMRTIKHVESDCELLRRCVSQPELCDREYEGILFDPVPVPVPASASDAVVSYMVYIPEIRLMTRYKTSADPNIDAAEDASTSLTFYDGPLGQKIFARGRFRLFLFLDRQSLLQKIRIVLI
jgi:hypothetical protein